MPSTDDAGTGLAHRLRARTHRAMRRDPRVRAGLIGFVLGGVAVPLLVLGFGWPTRVASSQTFALGALVLGFAVPAWVAAVMTGPAVESLQAHLSLGQGWSEADARQAFAILSALGAGTMLGSTLGTMLVAAL